MTNATRQRFRPTFWATLVVLPCLAILVSLGVWQLDRMTWKSGLIAEMEERTQGPAIALPEEIGKPEDLRFQRVALTGRYRHDAEIHREAQMYRNQAGLHVITPFVLEDGRELLVNRGWVPRNRRDPATRADTQPESIVEIEAIVRVGGWQGMNWVRPENDPASNVWVWMDLDAMADEAAMQNPVTTVYVDLAEGQNPGALPVDGRTEVNLTENHLGYAITWFGIALGLLAIYIIFHLRPEGRTPRDEQGAKRA